MKLQTHFDFSSGYRPPAQCDFVVVGGFSWQLTVSVHSQAEPRRDTSTASRSVGLSRSLVQWAVSVAVGSEKSGEWRENFRHYV